VRSLWHLADFLNGRAFKPDDFTASGLPVIRIRQLVDPAAECDRFDGHVEEENLIDDGDLIFSWSASLAVRIWERGPAVLNQHLYKVVSDSDVNKRWLRWRLEALIVDFQGLMHGSAMTHLTTEMLRATRVDVPPLDQQRRIADFLDAETARIDRLAKAKTSQAARLAELWESSLAHGVDELIETYGLVALGRLTDSIEQGWSPQCEDVVADANDWAVLKTSAVSSGRFDPTAHKRLPDALSPDLDHRVTDGDLVMTRGSGSPEHVGVAAVARTDGRRLLLSDLLYRVRLSEPWAGEFVALAVQSRPIRGLTRLLLRGQSGQTLKLRAEDIKSIEIPAVPHEAQLTNLKSLLSRRDAVDKAKAAIDLSKDLLAERRQALITATVTGEFDVSTASGRGTGV
jgi:type I restriction enzyme S subunit